VALPPSGRGYEVIRLGRNRNYGHPELVAFVRRLGASAARAKLGPLIVGDLSQPRGGPTRTGHRSHQTGLDADLGYAAPRGVRPGRLSTRDRERISPVIVVDLSSRKPTPAWNPRVVHLLSLAAADPTVDRIFVHATVKKMLCEGATARAPWQARVRPWWGHHDHFHVRLRCPADSLECVPQEAPPDDGCGATLAWWFSDDAESTRTKKQEADATEASFVLPPSCGALLPSPAL
jgi:penicillin-insensitive murein endopeptidase